MIIDLDLFLCPFNVLDNTEIDILADFGISTEILVWVVHQEKGNLLVQIVIFGKKDVSEIRLAYCLLIRC